MKFKLQRKNIDGSNMFVVYPKGYDYGRGFSTLENAFAFMRAILRSF
jgi:hypothetical protein